MLIDTQIKLDYDSVLLRPKRSNLTENVSTRDGVTIGREFSCINSGRIFSCVPIIAANMDTIGTFEMAKSLSQFDCMTALHKFYKMEEINTFLENCDTNTANYFFLTIGANNKDMRKIQTIKQSFDSSGENVKICIDVANGYLQSFVKFIEKVRILLPRAIIMAGNIATREMSEQLILSGADIVKVGIGSGSCCLTRKMTGVGYPQLSAVIECAEAAHGLGGLICADGGIEAPGDVIKALGGGADFVMLGGLLAGYSECGKEDSNGYIKFYGMSSETAMNKYYGKFAEYRASEGRSVKIKCKGSVIPFIQHDILGGLRSGMTLIGAQKLKDIPKRAEFVLTKKQLNRMYDGND